MSTKSENSEPDPIEKIEQNSVEELKGSSSKKTEKEPFGRTEEMPLKKCEEKSSVVSNALASSSSQKKKNSSKKHAIKEKTSSLMEWQIGDYCRAAYEEDKRLYEAKIVDIDDDACTVQFLGYGNKQHVYFNFLAASMGKQARKEQKQAAAECMNWNVGDFCRAMYSEDQLLYEAVIVDVGGGKCVLKFLGYGNTEIVQLDELFPSEGLEAREVQERKGTEKWTRYRDIQHAENSDASSLSSAYSLLSDVSSSQYEARLSGTKAKMPARSHPCSEHDEPASHSSARRHCTGLNNVHYPPVPFPLQNHVPSEHNAMSSMMMSWYLAGYQTGYYEALHSKNNEHGNCTEHIRTCCGRSHKAE